MRKPALAFMEFSKIIAISSDFRPSHFSAWWITAMHPHVQKGYKVVPCSILLQSRHMVAAWDCISISMLAQSAVQYAIRQRIVGRLRPGESVLDALKRLGTSELPHGDQQPAEAVPRSERLAALRSRLAGTVPQENK